MKGDTMRFKNNDDIREIISTKAKNDFKVYLNNALSQNFREGNRRDRRDVAEEAYQYAYDRFFSMAATRMVDVTGWSHPEVEAIMDYYRGEEEPEIDEFGQSHLNVEVSKGVTADNRVRPKAAKI